MADKILETTEVEQFFKGMIQSQFVTLEDVRVKFKVTISYINTEAIQKMVTIGLTKDTRIELKKW